MLLETCKGYHACPNIVLKVVCATDNGVPQLQAKLKSGVFSLTADASVYKSELQKKRTIVGPVFLKI